MSFVLDQFLDLGGLSQAAEQQPQEPPARRNTVQLHNPSEAAAAGGGAAGSGHRHGHGAFQVYDDCSSDSDGALYGPTPGAAVQQRCEPLRVGLPGVPTHVVLRVASIWGFSREEAEKAASAASGRRGLGHFLDDEPRQHKTATLAILATTGDAAEIGPVRRRRCAQPNLQMTTVGDTVEARWGDAPAEARVRLRPGQVAVCAALVIGTEILGVTAPLELRGPSRRFFAQHDFFKAGQPIGPVSQPVAAARLALELWPPGSALPAAEDEDQSLSASAARLDASFEAARRGSAVGAASGGWQAGAGEDDGWTRTCGFCDGVGRRTCDGCGGHGALVCRACDGMPPLPCAHCSGTGQLQAGLEAIGSASKYTAAAGMGGSVASVVSGHRCTVCWGAPRSCQECFGMGALRCSHCRGAGWAPCTRCVPRASDLLV